MILQNIVVWILIEFITRHISGIGTVRQWNINLSNAQPVYASIPNSNNSGQGFIHECDIMPICEWPTDESSKTEAIEAILEHFEVTNEANIDVCQCICF